MNASTNLRWGILYMLASVLALGFMPSLVRLIYEASALTALQVSAWRFILAAPLLWLFTMLQHREGHPFSQRSQDLFGRAATVGIFYGLAVFAFFSSLERIPVPVFILIFYSYPIIVALLSRLLGEGLSHWFLPAALLTLAGVALTVYAAGEEVWLGAVLALVSAYLIATYFVVNQRILRRWHGDRDASNVAIGVAWIVTGGAVTLVLIAYLSGEGLGLAAAAEVWWLLLLLSAVVSFGAYLMNRGIQRLGAASASVVATVEPLFTLFFAGALLGEWLAPLQIVGGVLILGSAALRVWRQWRSVDPAAAETEIPEPGDPAPTATPPRPDGLFLGGAQHDRRQSLHHPHPCHLPGNVTEFPGYQFLALPGGDAADVAAHIHRLISRRAHQRRTHTRPEQTRAPNRWALIALGVLFAIYSVITAIALEYIIAGLFGILFYAFYPTMVALLSLALGERLPRMFWLVLLGTTFGLILVLSPGLLGAVGIKGGAIGVVFTLVSAFLNACYILLSRRVLRDTQQVPRAVGWTLVGAFLSLAAMVVFTGVRTPNGRDIAFILGIVLFGTLLPRVAFYLGLQRLGAPRAALISTATPFVTVVLGVLTLNEFLTVSQLIGGALILASMIVLARTSAPQEQPAAPPQNVQFSTARP